MLDRETGKESKAEIEREAPLSPEHFQIMQNNFWMYFADEKGFVIESLKESPQYKRFSKEHPELDSRLREKMKEVRDYMKGESEPSQDSPYKDVPGLEWSDILKKGTNLPIYEELYEAYLLMREYAKDDSELALLPRDELEKEINSLKPKSKE